MLGCGGLDYRLQRVRKKNLNDAKKHIFALDYTTLNNMARYISDKHLKAYQKGGVLNKLFETIKEDPELSFEIRMNDEVMVHYHKDKILTITLSRKGEPKVTILSDKYYKESGNKPKIDFQDPHNFIAKEEMREYFREAKKLVYVYKMGAEFNVQQNIALGNHSFDNRFLVVDMEWQFSQAGIPKGERISKTRVDLIIVDTIRNTDGENDIYLAELKLGLGATEGASGTIDHVDKTAEIIYNKKACDSLKEDVKSIVKQKTELGLIEGTQKEEFHFSSKPKMMLILAYQGKKELDLLKLECEKAKQEALKKNIDEPLCIMHDALIKLS